MHSSFTDPYWIAFASLLIIIWVVSVIVVARRVKKRVAALLDLFDPGTAAQMDGTRAVGFFNGRPALISARASLGQRVRVCVSNRFRLPFEVRTNRSRKIDRIRNSSKRAQQVLFLLVFALAFIPKISVWKVAAAVILFFIVLRLVIGCYAKWMGYDDALPEDSRWEVSRPGLPRLLYTSYSPTRVRPIIDRQEIQDSVARLIGTCRADILRSPGNTGYPGKFHGWNGSVEAECFYRRKLLDREAVQRMLTELAILCQNIERIAQPNESVEADRAPRNDVSTAPS